ncbi:hypothetical protein G6F47_013818 [Rhizopus delemar]|nr:hypothetical protein G6F54_013974 [Rhizopus delemar]KAG1486598.1 hypothetical protein G6F53_013932 [Rhizopus delemar]KAG1567933.1 hypothetical protein G6F47_013818 [Rhizopus delemar]KAG1608205.1 hypothetical protein G6F44_013729 [Rhizopus delemar]
MGLQSSSMETKDDDILERRSSSRRHSSTKVFKSGDNREITDTIQTIPLEFFHDTRAYQKTSDSGLSETESIRTMSTLQNGRNTGLKRHHRRRRPYDHFYRFFTKESSTSIVHWPSG